MKTKKIIFIVAGILVLIIVGLIILLKINTYDDWPEPEELLCVEDNYNCPDFETQIEAQEIFDLCGGVDNDVHRLDSDGNGLACESLK